MPSDDDNSRLVIVGPDALARAGLASVLAREPGLEVAAEAPPAQSPRAMLLSLDAHALVWDLGPGADDGLPELDVPTVVTVIDDDQAAEALAAGAAGVVFRDGDGPRLAAAVRAVLQGLVVLDERFSDAVSRDAIDGDGLMDPLTPRELEVLDLLSLGFTNREIAERLGISVHTAKFHVNAILGKLDATTRTEAVVRAARLGVLLL